MQIFNKKKPAANLNNSPNEEFCSSVKKNFFLQNTNILMHAYHLILIKPFPILQTLQSPAAQEILSVNTKALHLRFVAIANFFNEMTKNGKKNPIKLYSSCLGVGWGRAVRAYRGKLLVTVQVDGAHKRPQSWVFKNGLTRNPYLGEWQHTVKKEKKKKSLFLCTGSEM